MKNLKLITSECFANPSLVDTVKLCVDSDTDDVFFHGKDSCSIYHLVNAEKKLSTLEVPNWDIDAPLKESRIISMDYILEQAQLCLIYSSGDIVMYNALNKTFDTVGSLEASIVNAAWSPDQELLVILTSGNTFMIMSCYFQPLVEKDLEPHEFGESRPITVGWGSKETQFHGSEGKGAAKVTAPEVKPAVPWDDHQPRVSWRGDGEFFVTSAINSTLGCRQLRIWSREGILQYTSEIKGGLEHPLCWRPSGNLITCTQQHPNKHEVVFFEKNGLPYGEFVLPFQPYTFIVKEVTWNCDSTMLAVWGYEREESQHYHVLLWTVNNYHWYLKQHLDFSDYKGLFIQHLLWDSCRGGELHILFNNDTYCKYHWGWTHHSSYASNGSDDVSMAVIDNDSILITPFRKMIVPPPMCAYALKMPCNVNSIAFRHGDGLESFATILSDGRIALCVKDSPQTASSVVKDCQLKLMAAGGNGFRTNVQPHNVAGIFSIENENVDLSSQKPLCLSHWTWIAKNELLCVSSSQTISGLTSGETYDSRTHLYSVKLPDNYSEESELKLSYCTSLDKPVIGICTSEDGTVVALQLNSGELHIYKNGELQSWGHCKDSNSCFPSPCHEFSVYSISSQVIAFGLNERFKLYCNEKLLVPNCTSYSVHDEYLLISTCDSILKCYHMTAITKYCYDDLATLLEVCSQQLERGAKIVASIPSDTKLILQMPRGNLEVINPRPLVLSSMHRALDGLEFKKAFDVAKRHRINLNILYDHNPKMFLDNVETFIEQIKSPVDLNLFLTSLQKEDVTQTMYAFSYENKRHGDIANDGKVDSICDTIRNVLEKRDSDKYIQTIIATYAQKQNPEMDQALLKIKGLRNSPEIANEALKFLLYLVDVAELYNVALGTYDLEIAIMVAEQSNMDPKEYLPFLNNLQEMEENYRKYKIDMHLQKYKHALENISKCPDSFDECISLIKTQRLYTNALFLFDSSSDSFKVVWNEYGNYLMEKMYYNEAGLVYTKTGNYEKALQAFLECCDWQLALCSARSLGYTPEKISVLCESIAGKLKDNLRYEESAHLLEYYVKDVEESIVTLIDGQLWDSALNLMTKYNRIDIAETHLKPALLEHSQQLTTLIDSSLASFSQYFERLKVVRKEKEKAALQNDGCLDYPDDDLFSDTSSVSGMSASSKASKQLSGSLITRKSSRSRKKQELKKYRLKEGSPNEDLALMSELSMIITKVDKLKDNFFNFLRALVQFDFIKEGKVLQQKMKDIQECIERDLPNIWIVEKAPLQDIHFGPTSTANSIAECLQNQPKSGQHPSEAEIPKPTWRKNMDIFLHCFD